MKLTGKEWVSLSAEENNKPIWTISQLTLNDLLNTYILENIKNGQRNGKVLNQEISSFTIDDTVITKRTVISTKFHASCKKSTEKNPLEYECVYTYIDISDFYNSVVDLYFYYAEAFNTKIDNIKISLIEINIMPPVAFTSKGFINSKILNQYDLDGQISILSNLLKTEKWEILDDKIIFPNLINEKFVESLIKLFTLNSIIDNEKQKNITINYCELLGINKARENIAEKIKQEQKNLEKLNPKISERTNVLFFKFKKL